MDNRVYIYGLKEAEVEFWDPARRYDNRAIVVDSRDGEVYYEDKPVSCTYPDYYILCRTEGCPSCGRVEGCDDWCYPCDSLKNSLDPYEELSERARFFDVVYVVDDDIEITGQ